MPVQITKAKAEDDGVVQLELTTQSDAPQEEPLMIAGSLLFKQQVRELNKELSVEATLKPRQEMDLVL